jgi:uncharacterized protein (TIGR00725 family)
LPIVGVIGSGTKEWKDRTEPFGHWLAHQTVHLLTGGGGGVMTAVNRAFCKVSDRKGHTIGILPSQPDDPLCHPKSGYPNPWIEIPIHTHLPLTGMEGTDPQSRNHLTVLSSNIIVAFPGGVGTASEIMLAVKYNRPLIAFVEREEEIPNLSDDVSQLTTLQEVQTFLISFLHPNSGFDHT